MPRAIGMKMQSKRSRVAAIDGIRGALALVVVAWHVAARFHIDWLLLPANLAVMMFFILSGCVLTRGWDGRYGVFLLRRFVRLWPVYAFCLYVGYFVADVQPVWTEFFWYPYIGPNSTPAIDPPIWSLFLEAWTMPFMPRIVWSGSANPFRAALAMVVLVAASLFDARILVGALFVFGAFAARWEYRNRLLESALPQWLGQISYSLYLTHWIVIELGVRAMGPWGAVLALPPVFVVAWVVWWSIERPSISASRWLGRAVVHSSKYPLPILGTDSFE